MILVTHATQNMTLCDKVVFMAPGGYLAFFGPPREALTFFSVENFADIYVLLGQPDAPEEWARRYAESPYHAQVRRRAHRPGACRAGATAGIAAARRPAGQKLQRAQSLSQFKTLTARYIADDPQGQPQPRSSCSCKRRSSPSSWAMTYGRKSSP